MHQRAEDVGRSGRSDADLEPVFRKAGYAVQRCGRQMGCDGIAARGEHRRVQVDAWASRCPRQPVDGRSMHEPPATLPPMADRLLGRAEPDRLGMRDQTVLLGGERLDIVVEGRRHGPEATDGV
jgi:hypothetical protein